MTDEQIKQNAIKASADFKDWHHPQISFYDGYIAGAHSRDEEINRMQESLDECRRALFQLRNPWISVEERLPEEHSKVLIMFCNGTVTYNDYIRVGDINYMKAHSKTITHWMPIPEFKKGE